MPVFELDGGPWEIELDGQRTGYFWVTNSGDNKLESYMVLEEGVSFPLPPTHAVTFKPMTLPEVHDPKAFYAWVEMKGGLGKETTSWAISEGFKPWQP